MGLMSDIGTWFRGKEPTQYDYPELPGGSYNGMPIGAAMGLGLGDDEQAWLFEKVTQGKIPLYGDDDNRPYVELGENNELGVKPGTYYLDRPGMSPQTIKTLAVQLGLLPATGGVGAAIRGPTMAARVGRVALQGGAYEAARLGLMSKISGENVMDPAEIGETAMWGAGLGAAGVFGQAAKRAIGLRPIIRLRTPMRTKR